MNRFKLYKTLLEAAVNPVKTVNPRIAVVKTTGSKRPKPKLKKKRSSASAAPESTNLAPRIKKRKAQVAQAATATPVAKPNPVSKQHPVGSRVSDYSKIKMSGREPKSGQFGSFSGGVQLAYGKRTQQNPFGGSVKPRFANSARNRLSDYVGKVKSYFSSSRPPQKNPGKVQSNYKPHLHKVLKHDPHGNPVTLHMILAKKAAAGKLYRQRWIENKENQYKIVELELPLILDSISKKEYNIIMEVLTSKATTKEKYNLLDEWYSIVSTKYLSKQELKEGIDVPDEIKQVIFEGIISIVYRDTKLISEINKGK